MKTIHSVLICILFSTCTSGCHIFEDLFTPKEEQPKTAPKDDTTAPADETDHQSSNKPPKEIDESLVMSKNPEFKPTFGATTYHYALPEYDIAAYEFAIEDKYSNWLGLPITKITDQIFKLYKGKERPLIWISKCELLKVKTERFGKETLDTTCTVGFTLIVNGTVKSVYGYEKGVLYKADLIKNPNTYSPEIVAEIPNETDQTIPIIVPVEYIYFTLYAPNNPNELPELSILQAANELVESVLIPGTPPSRLEHFQIAYDGITSFNHTDAYEFTIGTGHDIKHLHQFFRMGVTKSHEYYTYQLEPVDTKRTIPVNLETPVPTGYNRSYGFGTTYVKKYYHDDGYSLEIPAPRFRTTQQLTPETAALGLVKLLDSALIIHSPLFKPQMLQKLNMTSKYDVTIYKDYSLTTPKFISVIWTGVDTIGDEEALEFNINKVNCAVTQSGKVYTYNAKPVMGGNLDINPETPILLHDYRRQTLDFRIQNQDVLMNRVHSYVSKHMKMDKTVTPLTYLTPAASEQYIDALIDEYKGESNNMPWAKALFKNGMIDGEKTYEFEVAQEIVFGSYIMRFRAAISENGKIYIYENDTPKLVRQVAFDD